MKWYEVLLTEGAEGDLEEIRTYVHEFDSPARADRLLNELLEVAARLATFSERRAHPKELLALGVHDFRQVHFASHRIIYRVIGERVFIHLIADGRRDMQALLLRRLVRR